MIRFGARLALLMVLSAVSREVCGYEPVYYPAVRAVDSISSAASAFQARFGVYPPETNWLAELAGTKEARINRDGLMFLPPFKGALKDTWGNDFVYRYPARNGTNGCDVYSLGKDGRSATGGNDPDDINNWDPRKPLSDAYRRGFGLGDSIGFVVVGTLLAVALVTFIFNSTRARGCGVPGD